jgi:hypothetical protein
MNLTAADAIPSPHNVDAWHVDDWGTTSEADRNARPKRSLKSRASHCRSVSLSSIRLATVRSKERCGVHNFALRRSTIDRFAPSVRSPKDSSISMISSGRCSTLRGRSASDRPSAFVLEMSEVSRLPSARSRSFVTARALRRPGDPIGNEFAKVAPTRLSMRNRRRWPAIRCYSPKLRKFRKQQPRSTRG